MATTPEAAAMAQYARGILNDAEAADLDAKYRQAQQRQASAKTQAEKTQAKLDFIAEREAAHTRAADRIQNESAKLKTPSLSEAAGRFKAAAGRGAGGGGGGGLKLEDRNPIAREGMFKKGGRVRATGYKGYGKAKKV